MLCWMAHVYRRNCWCNSKALTDILCPLLDETTISLLKPEPSEHQFRRDRQFIEGLKLASQLWSRKFRITRKGIAQPPWYNLETLSLLSNLKDTSGDPAIRKVDFIEAAHTLSGSRDLGAQLFCALLRSVGITTRLVCSMQPVTFSFQNKGPVIPSLSQLQSLSAPPTETPTPQEGPEPGSDRGRSSRSRGPGFLKKVGLRTPVPGGGGSLQYTPRNASQYFPFPDSLRRIQTEDNIPLQLPSPPFPKTSLIHHTPYTGSKPGMLRPRNGFVWTH